MPQYKLTVDWDGEEHTEVRELENDQEAEWAASDMLRDMQYNRTSSAFTKLDE